MYEANEDEGSDGEWDEENEDWANEEQRLKRIDMINIDQRHE